jgi:hypothetical protein
MTDPNVPNGQPEDPNRQVPPAPEAPASDVPAPDAPDTSTPSGTPVPPAAPSGAPVPPPAPAYGAPQQPPAPPAPPQYGAPQYGAPQQGAPQGSPYGQPYATAPAQKSPVLSIISLITGILGVLISIFGGWGFLFSVAAVVLGFLGRSKESAARGMWLTGLILGFVGIALSIIWLIIFIIIFASAASLNYNY